MTFISWVAAAAVSALVAGPVARVLIEMVVATEAVVSRHPAFMLGPAAGACLAFFLLRSTGLVIAGPGTDAYIHLATTGGAPPSARAAMVKLAATAATVGPGGSGGLIGPSLFIGAAAARVSGPPTARISPGGHRHSDLPVIGAAAMLGALLGAPVAGALLAVEVLRRRGLEYRLLVPALLGSWGGYLVYGLMPGGGDRPLPEPLTVSYDPSLVALTMGAALLAAGAGVVLVWLLAACRGLVRDRGLFPWAVIPGGLIVGALGLLAGPEVLGWGLPRVLDTWASGILPGARAWLLLPAKVAATAVTVGSGASGGVMAPALVSGAMAGAAVSSLAGIASPALVATGMAACLAAVSNVPLAAAVLLVEWLGPGAAPLAVTGSAVGFGVGRSWVAYSFDDTRADRVHRLDPPASS